jgi:hypothetical protein
MDDTQTNPQALLSYYTDLIENDASNSSFIIVCVFVAAVTCSPSRCVGTIRGDTLMGEIYEVCH